MNDEHNRKRGNRDKPHEKLPSEAVPGADQTPGVAGPVLEPGQDSPRPAADTPATAPAAGADPDPAPVEARPRDAGTQTAKQPLTEPVMAVPPAKAAPKPDDKTGAAPKPSAGAGSSSAAGGTPPPRGPNTAPARSGSGGGRALGGLALLVALAALGLSGWQWYQGQHAAESQEPDRLAPVIEQQASAEARLEQLAQQLQAMPGAQDIERLQRLTGDLQRSQQALGQRLEALQGEAQADWKLAEAEYMLRLASLRLLAAQDVRSAKELLRAADEILRDQPDSGVFVVREQLARMLAELETLPEIDRSGIFLRLAALHEQVNQIVALPVPVFDPDEVSVEEEYEDRLARRTRAERVLMRLERYVRVDFQRGKVITPLLDEAEMQRIRRTLQLTLEQAQWAALRGEPAVYRSSLESAESLLRQFFELDNPQVRGLQSQLRLLAEQQVALQTPDLAPLQRSLAAYIQTLRSDAGAGLGQDPTEAGDE